MARYATATTSTTRYTQSPVTAAATPSRAITTSSAVIASRRVRADNGSGRRGLALGDERRAADLRGRRPRDRVDDLDGLRDLVRRQPLLGVGDHLGRARRRGRIGRLDDRVHATAPLRVAEADDHDIGDAGVLGERALHLGGEDVGPAADDEVDATIGDVEVAVLVEVAEVAGRAETVVGGRQQRRAAEVGVEAGRGRPHVDLAHLARGQLAAVVADDP